jgi:hypothetical protein
VLTYLLVLGFPDGGSYMQKFDYRSPRFLVDLPVEFIVDRLTVRGRCKDISREGMRLEFWQPLPPNASGIVSLSYQNQTLEFNVRVAHAGPTHGGMEFVYKSESERSAVARLIASLAAASANQPGPALMS